MTKKATRRGILTAGGTALLCGLAGCSTSVSTSSTPNNATESGEAAATTESRTTAVYEATIDAVVLVRTASGRGTGLLIDGSHIVTNAHVVGNADEVAVRFREGEWSVASVLGVDPHSDLAALGAESVPETADPVAFSDKSATVGQRVLAIGNPYNLDGTVTTGIISGVNRSIPAPSGYDIPDAIQTDAPVNPGNSGGPLVAVDDGEVLAVINSGGGDNIGFGISAALAQRVVPELIETGDYDHPYMGISFEDVTPIVADANGLEEPRGLLVVRLDPDGPAVGTLQPSTDIEIVGNRRVTVGGDILLDIDGTPIKTSEDLGSYLALQTRPGDVVDLRVWRDGEEMTVPFELGKRPL
ncbi:MAG: serine proteinase [Halonotius sp. J07HN6]|nr:MAG: serine proteinase [Halonotius sp. J07HN6]